MLIAARLCKRCGIGRTEFRENTGHPVSSVLDFDHRKSKVRTTVGDGKGPAPTVVKRTKLNNTFTFRTGEKSGKEENPQR